MAKKKEAQPRETIKVGNTKYVRLVKLPSKIKYTYIRDGKSGEPGALFKAIGENFDGVHLVISSDRWMAIPKAVYEEKERTDKFFAERLQDFLVEYINQVVTKLEKNGELFTPVDVRCLFEQASEEFTAKKNTTEYMTVLGGIPQSKLKAFVGENEKNLRLISKECDGLQLLFVGNEIVVDKEQLNKIDLKDGGVSARVALIMSVLKEALKRWNGDGNFSEANLEAILNRVRNHQNKFLKGFVEITENKQPVTTEELKPSIIEGCSFIDPVVVKKTCPSDKTYLPSLTIAITGKEGHSLRAKLGANNNAILFAVRDSVEGLQARIEDKNIILLGKEDVLSQGLDRFVKYLKGHQKAFAMAKKAVPAQQCALLDYIVAGHDIELLSEGFFDRISPASAETKKVARKPVDLNVFTELSDNQRVLKEQLYNRDRTAVVALGKAGTGKTSIAIQTALDLILNEPKDGCARYEKIYLSRPFNMKADKMGILPGDINDKTRLDYKAYYDSILNALSIPNKDGRPNKGFAQQKMDEMFEGGQIEILPTAFLLGCSFKNAIIILDEAETIPVDEMECFLTRAEDTSRLFVLGDVAQEKNKFLSDPARDWFDVPSTFSIDENGVGFVRLSNGREYELGHNSLLGDFEIDENKGLLKYRPRNGLSMTAINFSTQPELAFVSLGLADVKRGKLARKATMVSELLRRPPNKEKNAALSNRKGFFDIEAAVCAMERELGFCDEQPNEPQQGFGEIIPIRSLKAG